MEDVGGHGGPKYSSCSALVLGGCISLGLSGGGAASCRADNGSLQCEDGVFGWARGAWSHTEWFWPRLY